MKRKHKDAIKRGLIKAGCKFHSLEKGKKYYRVFFKHPELGNKVIEKVACSSHLDDAAVFRKAHDYGKNAEVKAARHPFGKLVW